jgi:hypothetical protein
MVEVTRTKQVGLDDGSNHKRIPDSFSEKLTAIFLTYGAAWQKKFAYRGALPTLRGLHTPGITQITAGFPERSTWLGFG